jgi:hypothetical protein
MMKLKTILLGVVLAGVSLVTPLSIVQAQSCSRSTGVVAPSKETRLIRNERFNYRFQIPVNYKAMGVSSERVLILDPKRYEEAQCLQRIRAGTEFPNSITVYTEPVNPGNRSVADLVRQSPLAKVTGTRTVANQTAVTYTTDSMGYGEAHVAFFTPDRKHMIVVSAPFQSQQNSRGERVRGDIFNKSVFNTVVSSFIFVRR